jgi:hypothetical protein
MWIGAPDSVRLDSICQIENESNPKATLNIISATINQFNVRVRLILP